MFAEHSDQVWVLEESGNVFAYVTFWLFPERSYGHIDNNAATAPTSATPIAESGTRGFVAKAELSGYAVWGARGMNRAPAILALS